MRIAISGKGGAGKTTLSAGLARYFADQGRRVFAIDADPDANLAPALGATDEQVAACTPLSQLDDLIEERTGSRPGTGGMFRINPDVADVPESCGVLVNGVTVLRMGTVERGGAGCMCSESVFLQAFVRNLLLERDDVVVLDMEAGVEHLGRGTARGVDAFVVVVEPASRSLQTAALVRSLAADLGVQRVVAVANKITSAEDEAYVRDALGETPVIAIIPDSPGIREADRRGESPYDLDPTFRAAVAEAAAALERLSTVTTPE